MLALKGYEMKLKVLATTFVLASLCYDVRADRVGDSQLTYMNSQILPIITQVCSEHILGYREQFESTFARWKQRNKDYIASGEALAREDAEKQNVDLEKETAKFAQAVTMQLVRQPTENVIAQCELNLRLIQTEE
jgi:hypothetical protein